MLAAAFGVVAFALLITYLFPGARRRGALTDEQRLLWARAALAATTRGRRCAYNLGEDLVLESSAAAGALRFRLRLREPLRNFLGSMHGGAIASAVDVATSAAIASAGAFPGVSASLGISYLAGCGSTDGVLVEPKVLKLGANLAYTECHVRRASDGVLMARGWHVKYVATPRVLAPLFALRTSLACTLVRRMLVGPRRVRKIGGVTLVLGTAEHPPTEARRGGDDPREPRSGGEALGAEMGRSGPPRGECAFDCEREPTTGFARDDAGKRAYFATFGAAGRPMQGWDAPLRGSLALERRGAGEPAGCAEPATWLKRGGDPSTWRMVVGREHCNPYGALHGGCAASLVDVLGSAEIAFGDAHECGVAVGLEVQYCASAKAGDVLEWSAAMLRRGGRLATVEVRATDARGRLVCVGTVTKSLRGLSKRAP